MSPPALRQTVSTNTDVLVIGDADYVQFADGMQTGKIKKADRSGREDEHTRSVEMHSARRLVGCR